MTEPTSWSLRGLLRAVLLSFPAYLMVFVSEVEALWTKRYGDADAEPSVRDARYWALICSLFHATAIVVIWAASKNVAPHFLKLITRMELNSLPYGTAYLIAFSNWGWLSLFLIPFSGWGLFKLRCRGGVSAAYADALHGLTMLALVYLGAFVGLGALEFIPYSYSGI